jgi:hypothetical protein
MHDNALYEIDCFRTALRRISGSRRGRERETERERETGGQGQVKSEKVSVKR